ncbi:hypothetical protein GCM10009853_020450 [Glycomyces scopariae]
MTVVDLLDRDRGGARPAWDAPPPPEYQRQLFEWYVARAKGRLDEFERAQSATVVVIDVAPEY